MEEECSTIQRNREGKSGELKKKRAREVWVGEEKKKKKAKKWNKNRLMMELVSRWGSPLTSEAPHSLAYPSPVKRRGHTTDLSDCQGSSARPTLSLFLSFSGCGGAMHISIRQQSTAPLSGCRGNPSCFREGALTSPQPGVSSDLQFLFQFLCVCDCRDGSVGIAKLLTPCGSWLLLSQKPDIWTAQAIWLHAAG